MDKIEQLWKDKKRPIFGLPLSFTNYKLTEEKLIIQTGIFSLKEEEIKLYKVTDITLYRGFLQRIFGVGTIHICSGDKTAPEIDIKDVKDSSNVKELISQYVEICRDKKRVSAREIISTYDDDEDDDDIHG